VTFVDIIGDYFFVRFMKNSVKVPRLTQLKN